MNLRNKPTNPFSYHVSALARCWHLTAVRTRITIKCGMWCVSALLVKTIRINAPWRCLFKTVFFCWEVVVVWRPWLSSEHVSRPRGLRNRSLWRDALIGADWNRIAESQSARPFTMTEMTMTLAQIRTAVTQTRPLRYVSNGQSRGGSVTANRADGIEPRKVLCRLFLMFNERFTWTIELGLHCAPSWDQTIAAPVFISELFIVSGLILFWCIIVWLSILLIQELLHPYSKSN
jgi:hypothetical protein